MKACGSLVAALRLSAILGGSTAALLSDPATALGSPSTCDRQCLIGFASQYAAALVDHAPRRVPTVPGVRFTENLVPLVAFAKIPATSKPVVFEQTSS